MTKDDDKLMVEIIEHNKKLIEEYPFLKIDDNCDTIDYTWLDDMPIGWRIAFGEQMCKEIKEELIKNNELDSYKIIQIKEKFGGLRWYDNSGLPGMQFIIAKYEALSEKTCINCGKPANWISKGWISPYCDDCATKQAKAQGVDINKKFNKIQED